MVSEAKDRLRDLRPDQWSDDGWSDKAGRRRADRVRSSIESKKTWLAEFTIQLDAGGAKFCTATVTVEPETHLIMWTGHGQNMQSDVYLGRLVVTNDSFGYDIPASVIYSVTRQGREQFNAKSIRIDVWTANDALHTYYRKRDLRDRRVASDRSYPAGRRFERSTASNYRTPRSAH
jgi:hypothetical protein